MTGTAGKRGRPKDESKRQALLGAARRLFLERGAEVTTDEVAAAAGVAKATLYAYFADKSQLIEAVILRESATIISEDLIRQGVPFEKRLELYGERYVRFVSHKDVAGWDRLVAHGARSDPTLPNRFFDAGPGRWHQLLMELLMSPEAKKALRVPDAHQAADDLTGLWLGLVGLQIRLGAAPSLTTSEVARRVRHGIDVFLSHYRRNQRAAG